MADLQQTTMKVIAIMAKYDADHDITPGLPVVNFTEMSILNILLDVLTIANAQQQQILDLQKKTAILRAAKLLKSETQNETDRVH